MITLSIDVKLLQKERFKKHTKRDNTEALYAELVLIPTPNSEYGDYIVKQSVTKEEREAGKQLPILGNAKHLQRSAPIGHRVPAPDAAGSPDADGPPESDDVPF